MLSCVMQTVREDNHNAALALSAVNWFVLYFCSALNRKTPDIHLVYLNAMVTPGIKASFGTYDSVTNGSWEVQACSLHRWQLTDQQEIYKHKYILCFKKTFQKFC